MLDFAQSNERIIHKMCIILYKSDIKGLILSVFYRILYKAKV